MRRAGGRDKGEMEGDEDEKRGNDEVDANVEVRLRDLGMPLSYRPKRGTSELSCPLFFLLLHALEIITR